jgi:putative toxin-antitoxin system antitoxin component (TIGR02293 family)
MKAEESDAMWHAIFAIWHILGHMSTGAFSSGPSRATAPATRSELGLLQRTDWSEAYALAMELLGGHRVLKKDVASIEDAHFVISRGLPAEAMLQLLDNVHDLTREKILSVIVMSPRSFARRRSAPKSILPMDASGRVWLLAETVARATQTFGSQEAAERWLDTPAVGLPNRAKPIDLLTTPPGAQMVSELLTRIEHGVYT